MNNTTQIGGKGTMRKKSKKNVKRFDSNKPKLEKIIENINVKLMYMGNETKKQLTEFLFEDLNKILKNIKNEDLKSKSIIIELKKDKIEFFNKIFFVLEENYIIILRENIYENIQKYFQGKIKDVLYNFINSIDKILVSNTKKNENEDQNENENNFNIDNISDKYDSDLFNKALNFFEIKNSSSKIHFKDINNIFNCIENKTEEHYYYYECLKKQYEDYLINN